MSGDLPRVRASSLSVYPGCARRFAAIAFREEIERAGFRLHEVRQGIGAAIGTSVHAAAALTLREKAATGSPAPLDTMTDCAVETYREESAKAVLYDDTSPDGRTAERQVVRMVRAYQAAVAPDLRPALVEEHLEAETSVGLILTGHTDLVTRDPGTVVDLKTSRHARGYHVPQLGSYSLLARSNGVAIEAARIDHLKRVPLRDEQPPVIPEEINVSLAENEAVGVLRHIAHDIKIFREGDQENSMLPGDLEAFLANPSSPLCARNYNPAWSTEWCALCRLTHPEKD